ncbi:MAG: type II secretion system secretin GspD [Porticoccaceae bacterium]
MRLKFAPLLAALCLSLVAGVTAAIDEPVIDEPIVDTVEPVGSVESNSSDSITLNLKDAELEDLVRWASQVTGKTIVVHPNVKGRVTVVATEPMSTEEAYQVFLSTLQVYGFSVVDVAGVLKVIPLQQAKEANAPLSGTSVVGQEDMVVRIVRVKNVSAVELAALVKPMVPQSAHLAAYGPSNAILIAASAGKVDQIAQIVGRFDQAGAVDIELVALEFASAKEIAKIVTKLMEQGRGEGKERARLTVAVDERSNSLLLTGDPAVREQIHALVTRLDQPLAGEGNTQVLYLQYAKAPDLVPVLEKVSGSFKKDEKDQSAASVEVNISANEALNALILTAPPALLSTLRGVIAKLDVRRAQVLVEALIVEVNEDLARDLGVQWQTDTGTSVFGGFSGLPKNVPPPTVTPSGSLTLGGGLSLGYLRGGDLRAIIRALEGNTNANVLSTPTILALDNEEAKILVGSSVPFVTGSQLRDSVNNPGDPFQTIQREDIGVTLKIKPRINTNNSVTLDIEQKVENLDQSNIATADVITNKREIKTRVLIDNDQVLVLGGLIRDEVSEVQSKVPVLGDIPLVGRAFRSTSSTVTKKNLMVFIHPVILRDNLGSHALTRERYRQMEEWQRGFRDRVERFSTPAPLPALPELKSPPAASGTPGNE